MAAKTFSKPKIKKGKTSVKSASKKQTKLKTTSSSIELSKSFFDPENPLPVVYQPNSTTQKSKQILIQWIKSNKRALTDDLKQYGAILFRGFDVTSPQDFSYNFV